MVNDYLDRAIPINRAKMDALKPFLDDPEIEREFMRLRELHVILLRLKNRKG
jgi:hypothetical protein